MNPPSGPSPQGVAAPTEPAPRAEGRTIPGVAQESPAPQGGTTPPASSPPTLPEKTWVERTLPYADIVQKMAQTMAALVGIVTGIYITIATVKWIERQSMEKTERERIAATLVLASEWSSQGGLRVRLTMTNTSARTIHAKIIGFRVWDATWIPGRDTASDSPGKLLYSSVEAADCPPQMCTETAPSAVPSGHEVFVPKALLRIAPNEAETVGFGPLSLNQVTRQADVVVQALVYWNEWDEGTRTGTCAYKGPSTAQGGLPSVGRASEQGGCKYSQTFQLVRSPYFVGPP